MKYQHIIAAIVLLGFPGIQVLAGDTTHVPGYFFGLIVGWAATAFYVAGSHKWKYIKR